MIARGRRDEGGASALPSHAFTEERHAAHADEGDEQADDRGEDRHLLLELRDIG